MAFKATLDVGEGELILNSVHFSLSQQTNHQTLKPTSEVSAAAISCEIRADKESIVKLWEWGMKSNMKKDGIIKFFKIDEDASQVELSFTDGYCTHFSSHMSANSSEDMSVSIEISARMMKLDDHEHEMKW